MKKVVIFLASVVLISVSSCQMGSGNAGASLFPEDNGKVIAEFDGVKITDKYLNTYLEQLNPYLKSRYNTPEKKEELFTKIVEGELLARYAINQGALDDPALLSKIKSTIARYYSGTKMKVEIEESLNINEEAMKKYYEENSETYNQPEKVKASHILIKVDENRSKEEARKIAQKVLKEAKNLDKDPRSFNMLVTKYSDDEGSKRRGGDLGYFERTEDGGKMVQGFSDAAFALKEVGDFSDVVETENGFHIIKLTGKRDKVTRSFDDVKKNIEQTLAGEGRKKAYEDSIEKMKNELGYKFYAERAAEIDLGVTDEVQGASDKFDKSQKAKPSPQISKEKIEEMIKKQSENLKKALPAKTEE
jgi:peptidyl-prolyl cis-trans isomerase C